MIPPRPLELQQRLADVIGEATAWQPDAYLWSLGVDLGRQADVVVHAAFYSPSTGQVRRWHTSSAGTSVRLPGRVGLPSSWHDYAPPRPLDLPADGLPIEQIGAAVEERIPGFRVDGMVLWPDGTWEVRLLDGHGNWATAIVDAATGEVLAIRRD